jgi:hypothetical protein
MVMSFKSHPETSGEGLQAKTEAENADSVVAGKVADNIGRETEQGFRGVEVDPTPNENYTLTGAASGAPTPETDPEAAEEARKARTVTEAKAAGVAKR